MPGSGDNFTGFIEIGSLAGKGGRVRHPYRDGRWFATIILKILRYYEMSKNAPMTRFYAKGEMPNRGSCFRLIFDSREPILPFLLT
jgi:hypothetical protein